MQMTIQITDSAAGTTMTTSGPEKETGTTASQSNGTDGGAPTFSENSTTSAATSGASQLDIGGPPQWLTDGLGKEKATSSESKSDDTEDGGNAPSF